MPQQQSSSFAEPLIDREAFFDERLERVIQRMLKEAGHSVKVVSKRRTAEQQRKLYERGAATTLLDGTTKKSHHQTGTGADFAFLVNGQPSFDDALPWSVLGRIAKEEGLTWGGDWKVPYDPGHVQLGGNIPGASIGERPFARGGQAHGVFTAVPEPALAAQRAARSSLAPLVATVAAASPQSAETPMRPVRLKARDIRIPVDVGASDIHLPAEPARGGSGQYGLDPNPGGGRLAAKIRAKYPGAYDDLDDATLEKQVLAKYPQYQDLVEPEPQKEQKPPSLVDRVLADNPALPPMIRAGQGMARLAKANPSAAGAMAGGALVAPFTGGLSAIPAIATVGGASAVGSGIGQALSGDTPDISEMAMQGASGALGQGTGMALAKGAQLLGRGLYRAAALPINKMGKYGDLIDEGLKGRVPVSKSGVEKAEGIKASRIATKKAAVAEADEKVTFRAGAIADDARGKLGPKVEALKDAGEEVGAAYDGPLARFAKRHPEGIAPSKLEGVKGTLDDRLGGAYRKVRMREPLTPKETGRMELSQAASRAQESVIPNYRDMNRGVMNAEGLRQMISRRVSPGSSGGNQGLENALTLLGGPSAIPARIAMLPPVLSRAGIAANEVGQVAEPTAPTLLRALLAMLVSDEQRDQ